MEYDDLEKLKPEDYLQPEKFKTQYDNIPLTSHNMSIEEYATKRYQDGLKIGREYGDILINDRSVWIAGASSNSGILSSSEGIGYHRNTKELLQGFIDSGAQITVARFQNGQFTQTVIQEKNNPELKEKNSPKRPRRKM